jgi:hypothetical protein
MMPEASLPDGRSPEAPTEAPRPSLSRAAVPPVEGVEGLNIPTVTCYLGALVIISSLGWFLFDQWDDLGHKGVLACSSGFALVLGAGGYWLDRRMRYRVAGGLLWTCAISLVPLITYSIQNLLGLWPSFDYDDFDQMHSYYTHISAHWLVMELATVAVGLIVLRFVQFSFLLFPVAIALWFASMDVAKLFGDGSLSWSTRSWCSIGFGAGVLAGAFALDQKSKADLSFWLYLAGLLAFWGGMTMRYDGPEWHKTVYACINLALAVCGVYLQRRAFLVFAAVGVLCYLGHLAEEHRHAVWFPPIAALVGLVGVLIGAYLQRHRITIEAVLDRARPLRLRTR